MLRLWSLVKWAVLSPTSLLEAEFRCRKYGKRYDSVLLPPLLDCCPDEGPWRESLTAATRSYALRVAFFMENFSDMAGGEFKLDGALYCGLFGNVYDRIIDARTLPRDDLATLIDDLRAGRYRDHELCQARLMNELYLRVCEHFPATDYPLFHETVDRLHRLQIRSLKQLGPSADIDEIMEVTYEKGAAATLIFCAGSKPDVSPDEIGAIEAMGAFFQFMDDYEDRIVDREAGLRTAFTAGDMDGASLRRMLWETIDHVEAVFPASRARAVFNRGLLSWYALALMDAGFKRFGLPDQQFLQRVLAMGNLFPTQSRS